MGLTKPIIEQTHSIRYKSLQWTLFAILPTALITLYFHSAPLSLFPPDQIPPNTPIIITKPSTSSPSQVAVERTEMKSLCDYSEGKWVRDNTGPLYNGTKCGTIKYGQNCMSHGRPDMGYLYWRWRPNKCKLPKFEPNTFLNLMRNKHLAFVGDSIARNQLESLLCMLAIVSTPDLIFTHGKDNTFRRWHFPSHNLNVSIYWSPFLVKGIEKTNDLNFNKLFLDSVDEKWASDLDRMDMIVLSIGHWFLHPAVYFYEEKILGCHFCTGQNYTEIGFFDVFGKAIKTALKAIIKRRGANSINTNTSSNITPLDVIVTMFSPAHFEHEWDKAGACPRTEPYKEGENKLKGMNYDMWKVEMKQVVDGKENVKARDSKNNNIRLEALDVTKLSLMRPDGHPGPYMNPFPYAKGSTNGDRVQNDCVHWCLPGPVDTWNEILLEMMKKWETETKGIRWNISLVNT